MTAVVHSLSCIRVGTQTELSDCFLLATKVVNLNLFPKSIWAQKYGFDLFVAVAMELAYQSPGKTTQDVLEFVKNGWNSRIELWCIWHFSEAGGPDSPYRAWRKYFLARQEEAPYAVIEQIVADCIEVWQIPEGVPDRQFGLWGDKPSCNQVQIFDLKKMKTACSKLNPSSSGRELALTYFEAAKTNNGQRLLPDIPLALKQLSDITPNFSNLLKPLSFLKTELTLASLMPPTDFGITPILLLGEPGIGKTYLASQFGKILDADVHKISAGGAQAGFQLTGSHPSWSESRPGSILGALAEGKRASPVLVIDEIDKIEDAKYPFLPVLLDLLEADTAKEFKDEFLEVNFDASRIVFVMTANSLQGVPAPLLSRVEVFEVPRPDHDQRRRIIAHEIEKLRQKTGQTIGFALDDQEALADRVDLDLRKTRRIIKESFALAIVNHARQAVLNLPRKTNRVAVGFL